MQNKMKIFLLFMAILAYTAAYNELLELDEQQLESLMVNETLAPQTKGLILNSQAKKCVRNILKQMACGWPEFGIPPVAPYLNQQLQFELTNSFLEALLQLFHFRLDGLDLMEIIYLKVSYIFNKKIKYHFKFNELNTTALLHNTNIFLKWPKLGLEIGYTGQGPWELSLRNVSLEGSFKYKAPILSGSSAIYNFNIIVTVGSVASNIGGIFAEDRVNDWFNKQIEILIPELVHKHQTEIGNFIQELVLPRINDKLTGKKVWSFFSVFNICHSACFVNGN